MLRTKQPQLWTTRGTHTSTLRGICLMEIAEEVPSAIIDVNSIVSGRNYYILTLINLDYRSNADVTAIP